MELSITPISWSWLQPYGRFYAVYPESKNSSNGITFTKPNGTAAPSIVFTVNKDVRQQVDLMTACSGNVQYATRFQAPRTDLKFRHALTAIRFAVGRKPLIRQDYQGYYAQERITEE